MSLIPLGLTVGLIALRGGLNLNLLQIRSIGGFIPDVTVEEQHSDELVITEHPVEKGAAIADHAYKRPVGVMIRAGWSASSLAALGNINYPREIYEGLLTLQRAFTPFDVVTGKRMYSNMLLQRIFETTNEQFPSAILLNLELREVILTQTQTVSLPSAASMKSPELNAPTQNLGTKNVAPATNFRP